MPRKQEYTLYSFDELSPKAKKRAIESFKDDPELTWDDSDSQMLTETFEEDLKDHYGLGDMKVGWSLSCCQGDGVCFWGTLDIRKFIETEKVKDRFEKIWDLWNGDLISIKITNSERSYCHWNSMHVETELYVVERDLVPEDLGHRLDAWREEREEIRRQWGRARAEVIERNLAPVREWEEQVAAYKRRTPEGPREWRPGAPGEKPEPLKFPIPPEPVIVQPTWVKEIIEKMKADYLDLEKLVVEFEEYLKDRIEEISREMEKSGYAEMDYHRTDDYITERLENLDLEYLKDGERWDG